MSGVLRERGPRENDVQESPDTMYQLSANRRCDLRFWKRKLFSPEDPQYLHKTLGFFCILSFVYRYRLFFTTGSLGLVGGTPLMSYAAMLLHLALSSSSLIFHVLAKRIINRPMIIWEEYRLHAIVFTLRCFSVFVYGYSARHWLGWAGRSWEPLVLYVLVMAHHVLADLVTAKYGSADYTTVRIQDKSTTFSKTILRFYAFYQFSAVASHVLPSDALPDMGDNTLIAIQSSAFFMTLYRKSLVGYQMHGIVYTSCLILSLTAMSEIFTWGLWLSVGVAFVVRTQLNLSKYVVWAGFAFWLVVRAEYLV